MSWMKRQGNAAPRPDPQSFAAPQPYGNQQNMFPAYQGPPQGQQQTWQVPQQQQQQQQYNQQYGQVYPQQQPYVNNTNQYYQQPHQQYNQNYVSQSLDQQGYPQNYAHSQPPQQQSFNQNEGNTDAWEDNWGWGWEDSSKHYQNSINQTAAPQPAVQPQAFNNANVIEESFVPTNSWNWSMEDKKEPEPSPTQPLKNNQEELLHNENVINDNNIVSEPAIQESASNVLVKEKTEEVKSLSDKDVVKEQLPNLALGKRINLENLTPQWSIESQMSQDSSDGPHTQSEGTYRSENQSRNSNKSSPGPNTDATNFNFSHSGLNDTSLTNSEWSKHSNEDSNQTSSAQNSNRRESYDELVNSVQDMNIANHENVPLDIHQSSHNVEQVQDNVEPLKAPEPSISPLSVSQNQLMSQSMPPPPPVTAQHIQNSNLQAVNSSMSNTVQTQSLPPMNVPSSSHLVTANLPPPPSSVPLLPPTNFPSSSNQNPFKSGAPFSHKNIAKAPTSAQPQPFVPHVPNATLVSPNVVNKVVHQDRLSASFGANLETTPDNSERPDQPQVSSYRSMPVQPEVPDNLEIAPQNDRNEYLQTAHLSSGDYGENTDFSRNMPPPGLRRMGVGQQEVEYNQTLNISGDEPPPGLARMVPGQQTETDNYNQVVGDAYMDRQIDGQPTDGSGRPYRQAEGQQVADTYPPSGTTRGGDRRPVGLDRMVPGEPSNDEYPQYQNSNFAAANEHRVVTGVDHDYPIQPETGRADVREQNVDGSDYTEPPQRNPSRSVIGAREASNATSPDYSASVDEQQREITMEGENLQDLSIITYDGSNPSAADAAKERSHDATDATEYPPNNSRRQSLNRVTSGEDSERDRAYKASPRKDRDKQKSRDRDRERDRDRDRDRDRERDKDRGRYSRGDRKYDRDPERRSVRDDRRDRDRDRDRRDREDSPDARRHHRSTRSHRYETEDTDYYSDKERDRRQYREGSYTSSKPPRGEDRERRRYNTIERERRYQEERGRRGDRRDRHRDRDRFEARYRDIDPRKVTSLRRDRDDDDRRKGENYSSGSRAGSREATATDEDAEEPRRRHREERRRHRHHHYYEGYGGGAAPLDPAVAPGVPPAGVWDEALEAQRRQYEYYERLRRSDPAAYMRIYKQLLHPGLYGANLYDGYGALGYEAGAEERGGVLSGRSSANGLKPADTYYVRARDAASLRTDCSDRELTTDMSLNLHLEESTVRSERMTPFKYSTAHVKGVLGGAALLLVPAAYPADGRAAPLRLLPLRALAPARDAALAAHPGPLLRGVTHKKSVVEYCGTRARAAAQEGARDPCGWALLWDLLALLLRQNGVVVGSDIAELLMKNAKEFEYKPLSSKSSEQRGGSALSGGGDEVEDVVASVEAAPAVEEAQAPAVDEKEALDRYRELLIYGNRQEALEWAMQCGLWGHALQLTASGERRVRAAVSARFLASLPAGDPLHSLYAALAQRAPPAAARAGHAQWPDWRPHAAILLANQSARPEHDRRTITLLGDTLNAQGFIYSAQFCYVSAGVPFSPHPLAPHRAPAPASASAPAPAPPRLALLLADPRAATLQAFATNHAIFATEIYEYALSLSQDYVLHELTVYKLIAGTRFADAGLCERALGYAEAAARAVTRAPALYRASLAAALAAFADRLRHCEPALHDDDAALAARPGEGGMGEAGEGEGEGEDGSPRHQQWLQDLRAVAAQLSAEASQQNTPQHGADSYNAGSWAEQTLQQPQQMQQYSEPVEDTTDYSQYYQHQQVPQQQFQEQQQQQQQQHQQFPQHQEQQQYQQQQLQTVPEAGAEPYEEPARSYADPYWQQTDSLYGYQDYQRDEAPPTITMPGAAPARPAMFGDEERRPPSPAHDDAPPERDADTPKVNGKKSEAKTSDNKDKKSGWLGGILTKLALRAPNQMILPDDTNPSVSKQTQPHTLPKSHPMPTLILCGTREHKRWRDVNAADSAAPAPPPPPPSGPAPALAAHAQLPPALGTSTPLQSPGAPGAPGAPPVANIFKMQKSRHIKKSYVDVLNPGGARLDAAAPASAPAPAPAPAPPPPPDNYFVPAPLPAQAVQVSILSTPETSPRPPTPPPSPGKGGIYDPSQVAAGGDDYRSGI